MAVKIPKNITDLYGVDQPVVGQVLRWKNEDGGVESFSLSQAEISGMISIDNPVFNGIRLTGDIIPVFDMASNLGSGENRFNEIHAGELFLEVDTIDGTSGVTINRTGSPDYRIIFDESDDKVKIGESGSLKTVATLDDIAIAADKTFIWHQSIPSATWEVIHTLNKYPSIVVVDSANSCVVGDVEYIDLGSLVINFSSAFAGKAYLN